MNTRVIRHVMVRGRVQGVGYRAFVEHEAILRGIEGWVRNRRDGSVEAVFAGDADIVAAMIEACRRGPMGARVDALDQREGSEDELPPAGRANCFRCWRRFDRRWPRTAPRIPAAAPCPPPASTPAMPRSAKAGDAVALLAHPARHDAGKMRQVRIDIERHAVQRHPLFHADADGGDLVLVAFAFVRPAHPDADAVLAPLAAHVEGASVRMIHSSSVATKRRTSGPRRLRSSIT